MAIDCRWPPLTFQQIILYHRAWILNERLETACRIKLEDHNSRGVGKEWLYDITDRNLQHCSKQCLCVGKLYQRRIRRSTIRWYIIVGAWWEDTLDYRELNREAYHLCTIIWAGLLLLSSMLCPVPSMAWSKSTPGAAYHQSWTLNSIPVAEAVRSYCPRKRISPSKRSPCLRVTSSVPHLHFLLAV